MAILKTVADMQRALAEYHPDTMILRKAQAEGLNWLIPDVEILEAGEAYDKTAAVAGEGMKIQKYILIGSKNG